MSPNAQKQLIGALVAAGLAIAVYYGLISQKQADSIKTQADQTLGTQPAQQPTPQSTPAPSNQTQPTQTQPSQSGSAAPQTAAPPASVPAPQAPSTPN